jgi:hypothetical protein
MSEAAKHRLPPTHDTPASRAELTARSRKTEWKTVSGERSLIRARSEELGRRRVVPPTQGQVTTLIANARKGVHATNHRERISERSDGPRHFRWARVQDGARRGRAACVPLSRSPALRRELADGPGADIKLLPAVAGHASATVTPGVYGHMMTERVSEAARLDDPLRATKGGRGKREVDARGGLEPTIPREATIQGSRGVAQPG